MYPLPRVEDFPSRLDGTTHFTRPDLSIGYWQCIVTPKDREKTAFITPDGLFQFLRLPFGLSNAPATFQRLMDCAIAKYKWITCLIYMDDLLVFSPSFEEHERHVREIFQALRVARLRHQPSKCIMATDTTSCLGHMVSREGISPDPSKCKASVIFHHLNH